MDALKRKYKGAANDASEISCLDVNGNESNVQEELIGVNPNIRYNPSTDMMEVLYNGEWKSWKYAGIQSIALNIAKRSQGTPSSTASSNATKRTFNYNTYVVNLSFNNYIKDSSSAGTIYNDGSIKATYNYSGYGVGIPVLLSGNKPYRLTGTVVTGSATLYTTYYTTAGIYNTSYGSKSISGTGTNFTHEFITPSGYAVVVILICGNVTVSDLILKAL